MPASWWRWTPSSWKAEGLSEYCAIAGTVSPRTGWLEERIPFMLMTRLAEYQRSLLRRNGARAHWSGTGDGQISLREQLAMLRAGWGGGREI